MVNGPKRAKQQKYMKLNKTKRAALVAKYFFLQIFLPRQNAMTRTGLTRLSSWVMRTILRFLAVLRTGTDLSENNVLITDEMLTCNMFLIHLLYKTSSQQCLLVLSIT
jgi:hypothetical protein